jgi:hypothetical protein
MRLAWKVTDDQWYDRYDATLQFVPDTVVEARSPEGVRVFADPLSAMQPVFVDVWPLRLVKVEVIQEDVLQEQGAELYCRRVRVAGEDPMSIVFGPNGDQVCRLLSDLREVAWFTSVGTKTDRVQVEEAIRRALEGFIGKREQEYRIRWIDHRKMTPLFDRLNQMTGEFWNIIDELHGLLRQRAVQKGLETELMYATDAAAELVLEASYEGAVEQFEHLGEAVVRIASGAAMYISSLAAAWETVMDPEEQDRNPLSSLLSVFYMGHWPIGTIGKEFLVV